MSASGDTIGPGDVRQVARLARLELSAGEEALFARQLAEVIGHMRPLRDAATGDASDTAHSAESTNVFRDDRAGASLPHELALRESPRHDGECFVVPRVFGD